MSAHDKPSETIFSMLTITALVLGIYISGQYSFLLFHGLVELVSMYDVANKLGHIAKLVAFYLMYRAILVTGLKEPFEVVFRT